MKERLSTMEENLHEGEHIVHTTTCDQGGNQLQGGLQNDKAMHVGHLRLTDSTTRNPGQSNIEKVLEPTGNEGTNFTIEGSQTFPNTPNYKSTVSPHPSQADQIPQPTYNANLHTTMDPNAQLASLYTTKATAPPNQTFLLPTPTPYQKPSPKIPPPSPLQHMAPLAKRVASCGEEGPRQGEVKVQPMQIEANATAGTQG